MDLPGRLRSTTLGDILGTLHRAGATGALELAEETGRVHRIYLAAGLVEAVDLAGASPSLAEILRADRAADDEVLRRSLLRALASSRLHGEVLVDDFRLSPAVVGNALRRQVIGRLGVLERVADARLAFRVALRPPRGALGRGAPGAGGVRWACALEPREFLHGRRRRRECREWDGRGAACEPRDAVAWRVLGLHPGTEHSEVKRAYRRLAKSLHPDLHPGASAQEREQLQLRFAQVTDAYRTLTA